VNKNQIYLAITGDVLQSRNTLEVDFSRLKNCLNVFNKKFNPVVPFTIQAGDEIQGLGRFNETPVSSLLWLLGNVYPMKIRWGLGKGSIESSLQESTAEMRGESFEYSREALNLAKKNKQLFACCTSEDDMEQTNIIFSLISGYLDDWNKMAYRRYLLYSDSKTIYKVAELEGVSTEAINKHMNRKKIKIVLDAVHFLDETIFNESTL